jgi:triosephosphate isomerase
MPKKDTIMKTLIAANWKMNGTAAWRDKPREFREHCSHDSQLEILICPVNIFLADMVSACAGLDIAIGAQNCHEAASGAFTGEISAQMVTQTGASYVILGHSERRDMFGETDARVAAKVTAAQAQGLTTIVCIGEHEAERVSGQVDEVVGAQLLASLPENADAVDTHKLVIAYEPVWAIGTGLVPTLEDIAAVHDHIRGVLAGRFGERAAQSIQILYGGSVKPDNAKDILALSDVNGALIGGASLDMKSLAVIARALN